MLHHVSVGQGHLEARSDGGDCHVDTTEAAGTERLKSRPHCDLASKPGSHQPGHPQAVAHLSQPFMFMCATQKHLYAINVFPGLLNVVLNAMLKYFPVWKDLTMLK